MSNESSNTKLEYVKQFKEWSKLVSCSNNNYGKELTYTDFENYKKSNRYNSNKYKLRKQPILNYTQFTSNELESEIEESEIQDPYDIMFNYRVFIESLVSFLIGFILPWGIIVNGEPMNWSL